MQCQFCEKEVTQEALFCHHCGKNLAEAVAKEGPTSATDSASKLSPSKQSSEDGPEHELWQGDYSAYALLGKAVFAGVMSILLFVGAFFFWAMWFLFLGAIALVWICLGLLLVYRKLNVHYRLTNERFIHEHGILRRVTDRIEAIDMDDISFEQGIFDQLTNVGTIKITSSDRSHPEIILPGIDNVKTVSAIFDQARRQERLKRGLYIESV